MTPKKARKHRNKVRGREVMTLSVVGKKLIE